MDTPEVRQHIGPDQPGTYRGLDDLRRLRGALSSLIYVRRAMESAGFSVLHLLRMEGELRSAVVVVDVPCVVCRRLRPVEVPVTDDREPHAVVCESCDAAANAEVAGAGQPRGHR